jgi:hypothetical protein
MNSIDLLLLELVGMAEAPLYPTYRWLGSQFGRDLSLAEFLRMIERLMDDDVLRLWEVDATTHERVRWAAMPSDLERRYLDVADLSDSFDPFGLSLTPGPDANLSSDPDWEADFDFNDGHFLITAKPRAAEQAREQLSRLFPDVHFQEKNRERVGDRTKISGTIDGAPPASPST